jgi:hypothetical protein
MNTQSRRVAGPAGILSSVVAKEDTSAMNAPAPLRVAAILFWVTAVGFGVFCLPAIRNLLTGRDIPTVMGLPAYGRGPFERLGVPTTVPLLAGFLLVCTLEGMAGALLWRGSKVGAILGLALLLAGAIFWWGFALPFGPIFALVRTILIVFGWRSLR